jgi:Glycosyl transferase family 2
MPLTRPDNLPDTPPKVSVVIVCYEMAAQIENTLRSLLPSYQHEIAASDYEIILMDNGSSRMLDERVQNISPNLRYVYIPPHESKPNPAAALNRGVALARAPLLCIMIDGARMLTPGVLAWGLRLMALKQRALVEVRGWHLGPKFQPESIAEGYDDKAERKLLNQIKWLENGYRLFDISAGSAQTRHGISQAASESNCLFLSRALFEQLGGMDQRYAEAGGGLVNLDFYARAAEAADLIWTLLGEGTFHQVHGGAATGKTLDQLRQVSAAWQAESVRLRGQMPVVDRKKFVMAGHLPIEFQRWLNRVVEVPPQAP